jgi:glycosyltransferase involved in cell wall biosynthesis
VWSPLGGLADGVGLRKPYRRGYDILYDTRRLVAEAHVMVAQSPREAALFERFGAKQDRIRSIGLAVEARFFQELPPRGLFRHELGIGADDPMVLFVGRMHPTKGLDVLLRAAAIVKERLPRVRIVLIGWDHGALRTVTRLSRSLGLNEHVQVLPPMFDVARLQAYVDADVFAVAATTYEETSLAALEALASGTCCVLSRQCEVPGFTEADGVFSTDCDPHSFAAALLTTLSDPQRRTRASAARRAILAWHTTQSLALAHAALFQEVAAWRRGSGLLRHYPHVTAVGE